MTIKTIVECDGGCGETLMVDDVDDVNDALLYRGWEEDPNCGWQHYCPKCWESVKKEMEEAEQED